jgi:hypothetical protein
LVYKGGVVVRLGCINVGVLVGLVRLLLGLVEAMFGQVGLLGLGWVRLGCKFGLKGVW